METAVIIWLTVFGLLGGAWLSSKPNRPKISLAMVVWLTVYVVAGLGALVQEKLRSASSTSVMQSSQADLMLRLNACLESKTPAGAKKLQSLAKEQKNLTEEVDKTLTKLMHAYPQSLPLAAKYIVFQHYLDKPIAASLELLRQTDSPDAQNLADAFLKLYSKERIAPGEATSMETVLLRDVPHGWYKDSVMETFYSRTGQKQALKTLREEIDGGNLVLLVKFALLFIGIVLTALVGTITIIIGLLFVPRQLTPNEDLPLIRAPAAYGFKAVYGSFLCWLALQLFVSFALLGATQVLHIHLLNYGVLAVASTIAITYILSNGLGLLFPYYLAMKPNQVSFRDGFKFRTHVGKLGASRLVLVGILTWFAAVPLVLLSALVSATIMGSGYSGSSNPVIPQIMEAARSGNLLAIFIFYVTVSVLAPFCEESLFRGFLYSALRRKLSFLPCALITAGLFAGAHMDPGGFGPLFALGLVFAYVVERTKSTLPTMVAHGLWNGVEFTLALLLFGN